MIRRREFVKLLGGAAAAWPLAARGQQQPTMPVIGLLNSATLDAQVERLAAFQQGVSKRQDLLRAKMSRLIIARRKV